MPPPARSHGPTNDPAPPPAGPARVRRRHRPAFRAAAAAGVLAGLISVGAAAAPGDPGAAPMSPVSGDAAVGAGLPTGGRLPAGHNRDAASGSGPVGGPSPSAPVPASFPKSGPATWRYAGGQGRVLGRSGPVQRFRVAIESNVSVDPVGFAAKIDRTLGDPRSWTASGQLRLQRVPAGSPSDFTIYLATERTSTRMCAAGGTDTGGYTSCRTAGHVIINLDRWYLSVPGYVDTHVPLDTYRTYVINHETGHQLGYGHELCPGSGRPAPVMQQQTLGLHGCVANPWPYLDGRRYAGPSGHY